MWMWRKFHSLVPMVYSHSPSDNVNIYQSVFVADRARELTEYVHYVYQNMEAQYTAHSQNINLFLRDRKGHLRRPTCNLLQASTIWQQAFSEIFSCIRHYYADSSHDTVYFKSWIQRHPDTFIPQWHTHGNADSHGVLSVTDQPTATIYEDFEVVNKPGQIHIGPNIRHSVRNLAPYNEWRLVIAFSVVLDLMVIDANDIGSYLPIQLKN